jgi:hypothetical protein
MNVLADGTSKQYWIPEVQDNLHKRLVAKAIATVYTGPDRIVHSNYQSEAEGSDGTASTYSVTDYELSDDTLTVNRQVHASEHIYSIEKLQTRFDLAMQRAAEASQIVADKIDQYVLNLPVATAGVSNLDAGVMAGGASNGTAYEVTSSTVDDVTNTVRELLLINNARVEKGIDWVVTPRELTDVTAFMQNNGFSVADAAIRNGFVGEMFNGIRVFVSNNLTHDCTLTMDTNPTDGDTLTINGVTIKFLDALAGNPGEIHITASVDQTRANLEAFLDLFGDSTIAEAANAGSTKLSAEDIKTLKKAQIATTNNNGADTLLVEAKGTLTVGETFAAGTNVWGFINRHTIAQVRGSLFLALPSGGMELDQKPVTGKTGREFVTSQVYNSTIWTRPKKEIFDVYVR